MEKIYSIIKYSKGVVLLKLKNLNYSYRFLKTELIKVKGWAN